LRLEEVEEEDEEDNKEEGKEADEEEAKTPSRRTFGALLVRRPVALLRFTPAAVLVREPGFFGRPRRGFCSPRSSPLNSGGEARTITGSTT